MFSKCVIALFLIQLALQSTHAGDKFFRNDYTYISDTKSFYKFNTLQKTWNDAKATCEREGTMFFYPEDEFEDFFVRKYWNETQPNVPYIFIGIGDWNVEEVLETVDGKPVSDVYNKWGLGEPNNANGEEGCVVLRKDGFLNDDNCKKRFSFICKKTLATLVWNTLCHLPDPSYVFSEQLERCYKFHLVPKNWTDAYKVCNAEQSYLPVINSELEAAYLVSITEQAPKNINIGNFLTGAVHLGFKYSETNGWITTKGVPLHESGYNVWSHPQPDGESNEKCGSMFYNGQLNEIGCFHKMFFICEHEVPLRFELIPRSGDS